MVTRSAGVAYRTLVRRESDGLRVLRRQDVRLTRLVLIQRVVRGDDGPGRALLARVVSYETGAQAPTITTLIERGHDETLVPPIDGGIETDGRRSPGPRHHAAQAHLR